MNFLRDMPIKRKVTLVIMTASLVSLVLVSASLFVFQWINFRKLMARDLQTQAQIIAANSTAAVTFDDKRAAGEILASLKARPGIVAAALYQPNGEPFTSWSRDERVAAKVIPAAAGPDGFRYEGPRLALFQPVTLNRKRVATLYLSVDFLALQREMLLPQLSLTGGVLLAAAFLAFFLSSSLQRVISRPVLDLAETARAVAEKEDYSVRAKGAGRDELGLLTGAFNRMLDRIQDSDRTLRAVNRNLEGEIAERQRTELELRESRQRFEVAVLGSSDGLWDWNLATDEIYYSPRWNNMLGFENGELPNSFKEWETRIHPDDRGPTVKMMQDYLAGQIPAYQTEFRLRHKDGSYRWILSRGVALRDATGRPVRFAGSHTDITPRKEAEAELARLNEELVETSRNAGMAEITTGVLHNIGNVLNSANVSSDLVKELIRDSAVGKLAKVVALLREHTTDLGAFLTTDSRGKLIPGYLAELASVLNDEKSRLIAETESLFKNIGHIKDIIITQQNYARLGGAVEDLPVPELIEDALRMNTGSFLRRGVVIHREFQDAPRVRAMRPKVMQILINLFRNANQAMDTAGRTDKVLTIRAGLNGNDRVRIAVSDNGVGIPAGNLDRIFQHGFTTKSDGHGFGLHSCLLAAREMEGNLFVESGGPGLGATFTLELPLTTSKQADPGAKP